MSRNRMLAIARREGAKMAARNVANIAAGKGISLADWLAMVREGAELMAWIPAKYALRRHKIFNRQRPRFTRAFGAAIVRETRRLYVLRQGQVRS